MEITAAVDNVEYIGYLEIINVDKFTISFNLSFDHEHYRDPSSRFKKGMEDDLIRQAKIELKKLVRKSLDKRGG